MTTTAAPFGNPFATRFMRPRQAGPFAFVIFGASGDLTQRKLVPALYNLWLDGFLPKPFAVVGFARRQKTDEQFRAEMTEAITSFSRRKPESRESLQQFISQLSYVPGAFGETADYQTLRNQLMALSSERRVPDNRLFYLATPPDAFDDIISNLKNSGLVSRHSEEEPWSRVIVEKPYGHDEQSAQELNEIAYRVFKEKQIYRIDHYLGKETVQNILVLRLGNAIFEPLWNRRYIDHVQISVAESLGVGSRAGYFEQAGIIRDMIQSHIMQVFTLIAMEPPAAFEATAIRDEKVKVLRSLRKFSPEEVAVNVVRGQYAAGSVGGEDVVGYRQEQNVAPGSMTDTYVAMKLSIDNWRWSGVPFYLRSGKRLPKRVTEVSIVFKAPPLRLFEAAGCEALSPNILRLRIQPQEGISLSFGAKAPGQAVTVAPVRMDFMYSNSFAEATAEAYERLILDALVGDSTLFARDDEVSLSWRVVDSIIKQFPNLPLHSYPAGDWGPRGADEFMARDGREWLRL
ncbi:MAG: glucose-6-phosphate dehydrogenase [Candidatus Zixiibacteriota bacterium]